MAKKERLFTSFVFSETTMKQIDAMPTNEMKLKFLLAATHYGIYGIEPEDLTEIEQLIWIPIKDLIDNSKGFQGGAPEGNKNACKNKNNQNNVVLKKSVDFEETTSFKETTLNNLNDNLNHNQNLNGNGNGNDNLNENPPSSPSSLTAPQENYSKTVFNLFKNAGLPCQNGDLFRFQCLDFKNALQKLRQFSSEEVIKAVQNYIYELQSPDSWKGMPKLPFEAFVGSKTFQKCLPQNYRHENFLDYSKPRGKNDAPEIHEQFEKCPACGKQSLKLTDNGLRYKCEDCGATFTWEEINL